MDSTARGPVCRPQHPVPQLAPGRPRPGRRRRSPGHAGPRTLDHLACAAAPGTSRRTRRTPAARGPRAAAPPGRRPGRPGGRRRRPAAAPGRGPPTSPPGTAPSRSRTGRRRGRPPGPPPGRDQPGSTSAIRTSLGRLSTTPDRAGGRVVEHVDDGAGEGGVDQDRHRDQQAARVGRPRGSPRVRPRQVPVRAAGRRREPRADGPGLATGAPRSSHPSVPQVGADRGSPRSGPVDPGVAATAVGCGCDGAGPGHRTRGDGPSPAGPGRLPPAAADPAGLAVRRRRLPGRAGRHGAVQPAAGRRPDRRRRRVRRPAAALLAGRPLRRGLAGPLEPAPGAAAWPTACAPCWSSSSPR